MDSDELASAVHALHEVRSRRRQIEDEETRAREMVVRAMKAAAKSKAIVDYAGAHYRVRLATVRHISYDEEVLRQRLGDHYVEVLDLDLRKLKRHLGRMRQLLASELLEVGSPSRVRIAGLIEAGALHKEQFAGAFRKTWGYSVYVTPCGPGRLPASANGPVPESRSTDEHKGNEGSWSEVERVSAVEELCAVLDRAAELGVDVSITEEDGRQCETVDEIRGLIEEVEEELAAVEWDDDREFLQELEGDLGADSEAWARSRRDGWYYEDE